MVHKDDSERSKNKLRGKPFAKGNKRGKAEATVLDDSGRSSSIKQGIIANETECFEKEPLNSEYSPSNPYLAEAISKTLNERLETPKEGEEKLLELIESLDFLSGKNKISIRFSKKHNRMFRIQIFLNDEIEIRPVTYTGSSTGNSFWKLLKGALKK